MLAGTFPGRYHQIFDAESAVCAFVVSCFCRYSLKICIFIHLHFWSHDTEVWTDTGLNQVNQKVLGLNPAWGLSAWSLHGFLVSVFVSFFQFPLTIQIRARQIDERL